jgi:tetratricopeptide (TPR) repeat protein
LHINPEFAEAHYNLGNALMALDRPEDAAANHEKALALRPDFPEAHNNLGNVLKELGRPYDAVAAYKKALALEPDFAEVHSNLGNVFMSLGRFGEAKAAHDQALRLNHGGPWWNAATFAEGAGGVGGTGSENAAAPPLAEPPAVSAFKLQDTADQLEYFIAKGLIDPSFERMIEHYRAVLEEIERSDEPDAVTKLSPEQFGRLGSFYNRIVHYADAPPIDTGAVNPSLDFERIEDGYLSSTVSVTTFDDFLTPEALQALRDFCLKSTIFFNCSGNRFVASWITSGFNCGLLYQMAEELKERLPRVLGGHELSNMWVYRYRNQSEGVGKHTDEGAVSFNFWITPDDANLAPDQGGLVVYAKYQPYDWDWRRYNVEKYTPDVKQEIDDFLADAETITIPYRENRAVLFHSNLFHGSDRVHFKDGFKNRRMNVTMLFGKRGASFDNP